MTGARERMAVIITFINSNKNTHKSVGPALIGRVGKETPHIEIGSMFV
jgi:hypothetical protein